jgi:molybdate transport system substrate-binding protein
VRPDSRIELARVGIGVAIREGATRPDLSSVEAVRKTLLEARSIAYSDPQGGGITGAHISRVIMQMGIADAVKPKVKYLFAIGGGTEAVSKGEADIGLYNISEILPAKGVTLAGPLPSVLQNYITFSGALHGASKSPDAALAFLRFLTGPAASDAWRTGGFEALGGAH